MKPNLQGKRPGNSDHIKEVEKYLKFFTIKVIHCVLQARVGSKEQTCCNAEAKGRDWFNISLSNSDCTNTCQRRIRELIGKKSVGILQPLCVDIILKSLDAKYTILESWNVSCDSMMNTESKSKNHFSVYSRLGVLLKSVISISRILPAYYLSRKKDVDFSIYCKLHSNFYSLHSFELHNHVNVGSVETPLGSIHVSVLYRSKIWLCGSSFHDHTNVINDIENLLLLNQKKNITPFSGPLTIVENEIEQALSDISNEINEPYKESNELDGSIENFDAATTDHKTTLKVAFADSKKLELNDLDIPDLSDSLPFLSLIDGNIDGCIEKSANESDQYNKQACLSHTSEDILKQAEAVGFEDDFVLVELRPAFVSDNDDSVGNLYKQCSHPPILDLFTSLELEDQNREPVNINEQLRKYETDIQHYEEFFQCYKINI